MRFSLLVSLVLSSCVTGPGETFEVGYREPSGEVVFFAISEPPAVIGWRMEWDMGSVTGATDRTDVIVLAPPLADRPIKWVAWTDRARDSITWEPSR